jgi:hypothetical protein
MIKILIMEFKSKVRLKSYQKNSSNMKFKRKKFLKDNLNYKDSNWRFNNSNCSWNLIVWKICK